jgi:hypothetical protein
VIHRPGHEGVANLVAVPDRRHLPVLV